MSTAVANLKSTQSEAGCELSLSRVAGTLQVLLAARRAARTIDSHKASR
ncbi:MAG: hypothetical protein JOZ81_14255 [Chloroflexi bacterium]|nr:hypothetical protein [Chloroflexota bacterium]